MFLYALSFLGRCWKASELRLKSWDDLQKLWYVLLKEKNMLMTQRQMLNAQNLQFPNPEPIPKVLHNSFYLLISTLNVSCANVIDKRLKA
ncbi:hypothetical protein GIB67_039364 [Kingdonia uniflora]|uniref:Large ribosomal subunit protein uL29m n=1 Tax=Kingdonia uniflora TaxID=39325 RepID=A0A7J7LXF7_9MAGN|nr:hypothetical protein GIB67_039364 [Kingdonia uniflora]